MPNRLALLLCQAMLLRGEESQARLRAAVGYLAEAQADLQLPCMLAGCMEALFTTQDWDRCARVGVGSLWGALTWGADTTPGLSYCGFVIAAWNTNPLGLALTVRTAAACLLCYCCLSFPFLQAQRLCLPGAVYPVRRPACCLIQAAAGETQGQGADEG